MKKILVIGSSNTDMVIQSERLPRPGETVLGEYFAMNPGGKGANQAVAATRLGASVTFITKLGNDVFGNKLQSLLVSEGITPDGILTDSDSDSGVALIHVDVHGENSISVVKGANGYLSVKDVKRLSHLIDESDYILMQLEIPVETVEFVAEYAKKRNKKVVINPAPAATLSPNTLKGLFAITLNETEAEMLTGIIVKDEKSASLAAQMLIQKGVQHIIITMGAQGAYFHNAQMSELVAAPTVKVVDTTASGDVFNGAFVVALSEGKTVRDAVSFACRAASISVTRQGAMSSAPYKNEMQLQLDNSQEKLHTI